MAVKYISLALCHVHMSTYIKIHMIKYYCLHLHCIKNFKKMFIVEKENVFY